MLCLRVLFLFCCCVFLLCLCACVYVPVCVRVRVYACVCVCVCVCVWMGGVFILFTPFPFPPYHSWGTDIMSSCPSVLSVCLSVCPSVNPCVGLSTCADHLQKIRSVELGGFVISLGLALRERDPE